MSYIERLEGKLCFGCLLARHLHFFIRGDLLQHSLNSSHCYLEHALACLQFLVSRNSFSGVVYLIESPPQGLEITIATPSSTHHDDTTIACRRGNRRAPSQGTTQAPRRAEERRQKKASVSKWCSARGKRSCPFASHHALLD